MASGFLSDRPPKVAPAADKDVGAVSGGSFSGPSASRPDDAWSMKTRPDIIVMGVNHKTAEVELRECLGFSREQAAAATGGLLGAKVVEEVMILSTCNRVEILLTSPDADLAIPVVKQYLSDSKALDLARFDKALYIYTGDEAVRHVFRVAASLDSMVVGEPQILGQLKDAYREAAAHKSAGVVLNRLLHKAFFTAKRVRTETGIGGHAVSISYAAIELARKIFGELANRNVMLIGAGEMAELAVEHLIRARAGKIYVANRTFERGMALARRFNGNPLRFEEIVDSLGDVDIIISSTGAPGFVLTRQMVKSPLRRRRGRALFLIDIAVPRDIDPDIHSLSNVYVYDIDDLQGVVEGNIEDRLREALKAERLIDEAVLTFRRWFEELDAVPTIKALHERLGGIAAAELEKTMAHSLSGLSASDEDALRRMCTAMVRKILHHPTRYLKRDGQMGDSRKVLATVRKLFSLDEE
ncbi:MAG: glutamyl-tRNA reductase [Desulfobacterales bacterium]|nr:MAG: glutamyl-tRNA reductase [Desulfobacterales bacterium]